MADVTVDKDAEHAAALGRRYLIRFEEDTLRQRPLWIRLIIEFLGTFVLVTVAAGSGVINQYAGGGPISRTAAVIAPGAVVMAMIYAWGRCPGCTSTPPSPSPSPPAGCFLAGGCCRTGWCSSPGRSAPPCSCSSCSATWPRAGTTRSASP